MRLLFLGDLVGRTGRKAVIDALPGLRKRYKLDFVVVNGENAAGEFGITEAILDELLDAGADVVTLGNHAFDQKETLVLSSVRIASPADQFPQGTPGKARACSGLATAWTCSSSTPWAAFHDELDCPFRASTTRSALAS